MKFSVDNSRRPIIRSPLLNRSGDGDIRGRDHDLVYRSGRQPVFAAQPILQIPYSPHPFLHPPDCARAFYYTFRLSFVSLLHTPITHISFLHIQSSTSSLLHSAFSTQSDCTQCLYYTCRFNTANPLHPFRAQFDCARKLGRYNSHKYFTRVR